MTPARRMRHPKICAVCLAASVLLLGGCQFRPDPLSAIAYDDNEDVVVQVALHSADAKTIIQRELYVRLMVVNCGGKSDGFPADPPIEGGRIPGYEVPIQSDTVQISGRVPAHIYAKYSNPCVFLRGGGYFSGSIESGVVRILRDPRAGPNNSFKPKPLRGSA
ncbi:hypothetical protein GCM10027430_35780 [Lysobacter tyrosinilyticus]